MQQRFKYLGSRRMDRSTNRDLQRLEVHARTALGYFDDALYFGVFFDCGLSPFFTASCEAVS